VLLLTLSLLQMSSADNNIVCEMSISPIEPSELSRLNRTVMHLNVPVRINMCQNAFLRFGGFAVSLLADSTYVLQGATNCTSAASRDCLWRLRSDLCSCFQFQGGRLCQLAGCPWSRF
jgi:hypothetical protein